MPTIGGLNDPPTAAIPGTPGDRLDETMVEQFRSAAGTVGAVTVTTRTWSRSSPSGARASRWNVATKRPATTTSTSDKRDLPDD